MQERRLLISRRKSLVTTYLQWKPYRHHLLSEGVPTPMSSLSWCLFIIPQIPACYVWFKFIFLINCSPIGPVFLPLYLKILLLDRVFGRGYSYGLPLVQFHYMRSFTLAINDFKFFLLRNNSRVSTLLIYFIPLLHNCFEACAHRIHYYLTTAA